LWPESSESLALANLRRRLNDLRRAFGPHADCLQMPTTTTLRLSRDGVQVDVVLFDEAIARGGAQGARWFGRAVALYRGPLLEGCVEEWVLQERAAREQGFRASLRQLAALANTCEDHAAGAGYLPRLVASDPLHEGAHRDLMLALAAGGDVAAAMQVYRDLRAL